MLKFCSEAKETDTCIDDDNSREDDSEYFFDAHDCNTVSS